VTTILVACGLRPMATIRKRRASYRLGDWERQGSQWRVPRSSLTPILRFADVEAYVQEAPGGGPDGTQLAG
jgi:hypothetical protein